jgi:TonB-dependent receptor
VITYFLAWLAAGQADLLPADAAEERLRSEQAIIVSGYRESLATAAAAKRAAAGITEVIDAEGIADFPDLNLAEALQRVPGVAIDRDGGEGRQITVRGLSPDFTRVRINGIEALATTGGKDQASGQGGANRSRGFDFQLFAAELFDRATVRKTLSAETEEGALGAVVDLRTALPFDHEGLFGSMSAEVGYNDLSTRSDPRFSAVIGNSWADGKIGALLSVAYGSRRIREEGSSSGRWENPSVAGASAGCFQSPGPCNSSAGVYSDVNSAWHARFPRYGRLDYDWKRLGVTGAVQLRPTETSLITLSGLFSRVSGTRLENYLEVVSLNRGGSQSNRQTDVRDYVINAKNQLIKATFDDVDVRSEERFDVLRSTFRQFGVRLEQEIGDRLNLDINIGQARSIQSNPVQTTVSLDRYDSDGYSYDFSQSQKRPTFLYGFDVTDPANWTFTSSGALGDASLIRLRPNRTINRISTARLDTRYELSPDLRLKSGLFAKRYDFATSEERRFILNGQTDAAVPLPTGIGITDISRLVSGFGKGFGVPSGTPTSWLAPDVRLISRLLDLDCDCVNQYGDFRVDSANQLGANRDVRETALAGYLQLDFDTSLAGMRVRGDIGLRYARTRLRSGGFASTRFVRVRNRYDDVLPTANVTIEPGNDVLVRIALAKQMARPQLAALTPGGSISNPGRSLTVGNPGLNPIRARAADLNVEWYPNRDTQLAIGVFYKTLSSYIQNSTIAVPFSATGLPAELLSNGNDPSTIFLVSQFTNTGGGKLKGFELSAQHAMRYLPAPFDGFGIQANFTRASSNVDYILDAGATPPVTIGLPLAGLSRNSWNATAYYEKGRFSGRISGAYRSRYVGGVPAGNGNDARGKLHSFTLDSQLTLQITEKLLATVQALNFTDVTDNRWISLERLEIEESSHTGRQYFVGLRYTL